MITTLYNRVHRPTADEPAVFTVLLEAVKGELATHYILTEKFSTHREDIYDFAYQRTPFSRGILESWGYGRVKAGVVQEKFCYIPEGIWEELREQLAPAPVTYEDLCQVSPHITAAKVDEIESGVLDTTEALDRRTILQFARNDADAIDRAVRVSQRHFDYAEKIRGNLAFALRAVIESTQSKGA